MNFKDALNDADTEMISRALAEIPEENNKSRIRILTAKLKSLEKSRPKALREDLKIRKTAYEVTGWEFEYREKTKQWSALKPDGENTKRGFEGVDSLERLFDLIDKWERESKPDSETEEITANDLTNNSDGDGKTVSNSEIVRSIPISKIVLSPFEPQARRRAKFKPEEIESLGVSIINNGLRQPILVRPFSNGNVFQIVFGERRFAAMEKAGFEFINCFVEDLSDAQTIELQYEENHNRLEPDPLDDAFTFHFLQTEKNYTVEDLSVKFAMSRSNVLRRLKLNDLIPEAKELLSGGTLPLGHAVFMSALPEAAQKEIISENLLTDGWENDPVIPLDDFKIEVGRHIICDLSNAPFDTRDPRLHIKELICPNCTERTGYEPTLFDEELSKGDKCLNKPCFDLKSKVHLKLKREEIAEKIPLPAVTDDSAGDDGDVGGAEKVLEKRIASVPLVTERASVEKSEIPVKGKVLTNQKLFDEPQCEFSEIGLAVAGAKKGREVWTCRNDKCPTHHPERIPAEEKSGPTDYELQQTEKKYQIKVAMTVREKVLAKAVEHFNGSNSFWQYADLIEKLIVEHVILRWFNLNQISSVFKDWKNFPKKLDRDEIQKFVSGLDERRRNQLLFLCAFSAEGFMLPHEEYFVSQKEIEKLAKSYAKVDYGSIDADLRVELAPDEFKVVAEEYRKDFHGDEPVVVPRFWSADFEFPE